MKWLRLSTIFLATGMAQVPDALANSSMVGQAFLCPSSTGGPAVVAHVGRVDEEPVGRIVHVSLWADEAESLTIDHAPFAADVFGGCTLLPNGESRVSASSFQNGYETWRSAWDADEAGIWSISPTEAYEGILAMLTGEDA